MNLPFPVMWGNFLNGGQHYNPFVPNTGTPFILNNLISFWPFQQSGNLGFDVLNHNNLSTIVPGIQTVGLVSYTSSQIGQIIGGSTGAGAFSNVTSNSDVTGALESTSPSGFNFTSTKSLIGWINNIGGAAASTAVLTFTQSGNPTLGNWGLYMTNGLSTYTINFYYYYDNLGSSTTISSDILSIGNWYLVSAWLDTNLATLNIKINNSTPQTGSIPSYIGTAPVGAGATFFMGSPTGSSSSPAGNGLPIKIDEMALWNRILTSGEISILYNGGTGLPYPWTTFT